MARELDPRPVTAAAVARLPDMVAAAAWRLCAATARAVVEQAGFIAIALCYLVFAWALTGAYGQELRLGLYGRVQLAFFFALGVACLTGRVAWTLVCSRPIRPLRPVWQDLRGDFALGRRLVTGLPVLVLLPLVLSAYTSLKRMIPAVAPFDWDARLAAVDAQLHGGVQPWTLLLPHFGGPTATVWIDRLYGPLWFWLLLLMQFWQTFSLHAERTRFLMTFILCWALLGTAMAMAFPSAGPVYYAAFAGPPDPFAPLLAHLRTMAESTPLLAVLAQDELWRLYDTGQWTLAAGISAMPSMHLSMGMLLVLAGWRLGPLARGLTCLYLAILMIGSVHLAWHYAIDSYAAIAGTWAIWWAVGYALARRGRQSRRLGTAATDTEQY